MRRHHIPLASCAAVAFIGLAQEAAAQAAPSPYTTGERYDAMGRVTGTIAPDPDGTGPLHFLAMRKTFDADGHLVLVEKGELSSWQADSIAPANWTGFAIQSSLSYLYDGYGRKTRETLKGVDGLQYAVTEYSYDSYGRPLCTAVRMTPASYGGTTANDACTMISTAAPNQDRITRNSYDTFDRVVLEQRAYGTSAQSNNAAYTYLGNGPSIASVTDARGNVATMTYDGFGRRTAWNFPSPTTAGVTSSTDYEAYTYDNNGNRTSFRKRDGAMINYTYDNLNRMIIKDVPGTSSDVYYAYDLQGHQLYARFGGSGGLGLSQVYDGFGQLTSSSNNLSGAALTLSYQYDSDGNRIRLTYPDGVFVTYDHDGLGRIVAIRENGGAAIATTSYNSQGRRAVETRGLVGTTSTYDPISRLASISDDLAGATDDVGTTLTYNAANQTVSKARSNSEYSFGGFVSVNRFYSTNGLNQYTNAGAATFSYDPSGNLTSDGANTYTYDVENRLLTRSGGVSLSYDPNGRLWQTSGGTGTTRFLYDGDQLVGEFDTNGSLLRRYVHGSGSDDPVIWYEGSSLSDRRSLQKDPQGSIVSVANAAGGAIAINSYDEYGIPGSGNSGRFQFTGQSWIPEVGMYYYKARFYSPTLGRFLQVDPVGYKDQINLYAYVSNDPIQGRDPTGLTDVSRDCQNKPVCDETVIQIVNIAHQGKDGTVVDSKVLVSIFFHVETDKNGTSRVSVTAGVLNGEGKQYSNDQLKLMGKVVSASQAAAYGKVTGSNATQIVTAVGAVETGLGTYSTPGAAPDRTGPINPLQLSSGRENSDFDHNVNGAIGVLVDFGKRSDFDPYKTYYGYSDKGANTMANWTAVFGSLREWPYPGK